MKHLLNPQRREEKRREEKRREEKRRIIVPLYLLLGLIKYSEVFTTCQRKI